jgi:acetolactate decarboxylase
MKQAKNYPHDLVPIYLCAPVNALVEGIFEEGIPFSEIKKHGDFGLGTFDDLDGEMVMLDGRIFQIDGNGRVQEVEDNAHTPFVCVTFFHPHSTATIERDMNHEEFIHWIENLLPSRNIFYALRIEGTFKHIKVRSVPKQEAYHPLVEVAQDQAVFEFDDIEGTLVGFFAPDFMATVVLPGFHLHFLSGDTQHGGHLLGCAPQKMSVGVQFISHMELALPLTVDYLNWDFHRDVNQDLEKAEK